MSDTPLQHAYPSQTIFNIPFFNGNISQAVEFIWQRILDNEFITVATPNPEQMVLANEQVQFRQALQEFSFFIPDGHGILWAAKKFHTPLEERIAGVDVVRFLVEKLEHAGLIGLVVGGYDYDQVTPVGQPAGRGGRFQVSGEHRRKENKAAKIYKQKEEKKAGLRDLALGLSRENLGEMDLRNRFVQLELSPKPQALRPILYWLRNFAVYSEHDNKMILDWIEKNHPVVVFVALGAPVQELWIEKHQKQLKRAGVRCIMAVGGSFDVLTSKVKRAPEMVQAAKLEWFWRLIQQPWRWRRQLRLVRFVCMVMARRQ